MGSREAEMRSREVDLIFDATLSAIASTKRVLVVASAAIGLGLFHLVLWYCSWDLARIEMRRGVAEILSKTTADEPHFEEGVGEDRIAGEKVTEEADELARAWANRRFKAFLVGFDVSAADFSVALLLVGDAILLWLILHQRRVSYCLEHLGKATGSELPGYVLQYHFTLIRTSTSFGGKVAVGALFWGLPILGVTFFVSDVVDLVGIYEDDIWQLAFSYPDFIQQYRLRLVIDGVLSLLSVVLGFLSYREYSRTKDSVLGFSREHRRDVR